MRKLLTIALLGFPLFAQTKPRACPFPDNRFTDVDPKAFAEHIARGGGQSEAVIRLFRTLPDKTKTEVLGLVFETEVQRLEARSQKLPYQAGLADHGFARLMTRDPFAREAVPKLIKARKVGPESSEYLRKEVAHALAEVKPVLSWEEIQKITSSQPKKVSAWLEKLPQSYRRHYAAFWEPQALQGGSIADPRVIYYDDETIIAVNGDSTHAQHDVAEIMRLDPVNARTTIYVAQESADAPVKLSNPNPMDCAGCHGQEDPYGQLDLYSFWKGSVGSNRDIVLPGSTDEKAINNLREHKKKNHPRYKHLEDFEAFAAVDPTTFQLANAPTEKLGHVLNLHSLTRLMRLMTQTPNYCQYRYAIYAAISGCDNVEAFVPEKLRDPQRSYAFYATDTAALKTKLANAFKEAHPKAAASDTPFKPELFFEEKEITALRFLFEGRGISMKGWSTGRIVPYGWVDGVTSIGFLREMMAFGDQTLTPHFAPSPTPESCEALKKASLAALEPLAPEDVFQATNGKSHQGSTPPPEKGK